MRLVRHCLSSLLIYALSHSAIAEDGLTGAAIFYACAECHGQAGHGNEARHAPAIAGQPAWYLTAQLNAFRRGWRGGSRDDFISQQMALFAEALPSKEAVDTVAGFIAKLPRRPRAGERDSPDAGKELYRSCAVCHGAMGEGNEVLSAPPLVDREPWYLRRQLEAFRDGRRGTAPGDTAGQQMRAAMSTVPDNEVDTLVDFIGALRTL